MPVKDHRAGKAREKLGVFGIGINDAVNGVYLRGDVHRHAHTKDYYKNLQESLEQANTKEGVLGALEKVRQNLLGR